MWKRGIERRKIVETRTIDVMIPVYRPGREFPALLEALMKQTILPEHIWIMNTEEQYWNREWEKQYPGLCVHHLTKQEFDHGGTRRQAAALSDAEIMIFMTQDAVPADPDLIRNLIQPLLENPKAGAAYARQLPKEDCNYLERYTRSFNYPEESHIRKAADLGKYGIKTFFCSNVCAAYRKSAYEEVGGFVEKAIFNEDMICAGNLLKKGWEIAYAADARVYHSHNYSCRQQFHRNFDLGVSQAQHPEIFEGIPSEGEGLRLVVKSAAYLCRSGRPWLLFKLAAQSGFKYAGYFLGKRYKSLPMTLVHVFTMNPSYWK
jgi:rhamnosyltransferase